MYQAVTISAERFNIVKTIAAAVCNRHDMMSIQHLRAVVNSAVGALIFVSMQNRPAHDVPLIGIQASRLIAYDDEMYRV